VVIGNPPYNAHQVNENDNNKNRKYLIDNEISKTYAKDSTATNNTALSDVYVKAIYWASKRIGNEGIVAFVTNNSFINDLAFDGMRKHLHKDFNHIYILDLKGNIRKDSMRDGIPLGEKHTVFGLASMVGIAITFFIKNNRFSDKKIFYNTVDFRATRQEKFAFLDKDRIVSDIQWTELIPDANNTWLTEGLDNNFNTLLAMGTKEAKSHIGNAIFSNYGRGLATSRDSWVYNFNSTKLANNINKTITAYNDHVYRLNQLAVKPKIDDFVSGDSTQISWARGLKQRLEHGTTMEFSSSKIKDSLYRPFTRMYLYFDKYLNEMQYQNNRIFPNTLTALENNVISVRAAGSNTPFHCLCTNIIPDLHLTGDSQCFPFYTYSEDGNNRKENITDWVLTQYQAQYKDNNITKKDIFNYVYGILHHPIYREKYAANLKRELPHVPFAADFLGFATAGKQLVDLHINYEKQPEYKLTWIEEESAKVHYRVEKMALSKDKTQIIYNDFLTLSGIPPEVFEYHLGNRSALEWIIDQYQMKTDKRSGITNDPNRLDDPQYIVRLIGKVITVSLETMEIVKALPEIS